MESARKVALVPQQLLSSLMAQQQFNPAINQLSELDKGMQSILENSNLPADIKMKQYSQLMHKYQTMKDQELNKPMTVDIQSKGSSMLSIPDDDIVGGVPKNYQNKAKLLISHIKRTPNIEADEQGQIVINGKKIENSNIADLIFDYTKPPKRNQIPAKGWKEFGKALKQTNVPRQAIGNDRRWNDIDLPTFIAQQQILNEPTPGIGPLFAQEHEEETFSTPNPRKRNVFSFSPQVKKPKTPTPAKKIKVASPAIRRSSRERQEPSVYSPTSGRWKKYNQKR